MKKNICLIEQNQNYQKESNYGIQLLRMILSFLILQYHCLNQKKIKIKIIKSLVNAIGFYVPTFLVISYYFSFKIINSKNIIKMKTRLKRLFIPYIIWPIIFFIIYNIIFHFYYKIICFTIKDLFIQLLTAKRIHIVFWFQCNLILSFILLSILALLIKNNFLFIVQLIGVLGYFFHSFYHYYKILDEYMYEVRMLIKDFSKVLFYSAIGISLGSIINMKILRKERFKVIIFCLLILYLLRDFLIIINLFYYLRCIIYGIGSVSLFILFSVVPLDYIKNKKINLIIMHVTNYSAGVYYLHTQIWLILRKNDTLYGCFINYIICYFICFLGIKVFGNTNLKYLFI